LTEPFLKDDPFLGASPIGATPRGTQVSAQAAASATTSALNVIEKEMMATPIGVKEKWSNIDQHLQDISHYCSL